MTQKSSSALRGRRRGIFGDGGVSKWNGGELLMSAIPMLLTLELVCGVLSKHPYFRAPFPTKKIGIEDFLVGSWVKKERF